MKKKSQDELGTLVTREMKVMLQDESLTKEQRFDLLAAVMFDEPLKNTLMASYAKSLKAGFEQINGTRYKAIDRIREFKRRSERNRRHGENMEQNTLPSNSIPIHGNPCASIPIHGELKAKAKANNISPYKPPKGGDNVVEKSVVESPDENAPEAPVESVADLLAGWIEQAEAFGHMRVNRRSLRRVLIPIVKKNCAAEGHGVKEVDYRKLKDAMLAGLDAWTETWKSDDWQYAPGKITKWLADEKWLEEPRKKKTAPHEGLGCGECGAEIV